MAEIIDDYFYRGVEIGMGRAAEHGAEVPREEIEDTLDRTREVIGSWPAPLSGRFQEVFVEDITIASLARVRYEDQPLQDADLRASLGFWERIFNSFAHDE